MVEPTRGLFNRFPDCCPFLPFRVVLSILSLCLVFVFCYIRFSLAFPLFLFRKLSCMILKKVGRIGGDEGKVRSRLSHILSRIDRDIEFSISNVRVLGSGTQAPIYEVDLEDADSAEALRKSFKRFTRKKAPISRPPELDGVGVFNSVTHATRVRISILRVSYLVFFSFYFPFLEINSNCR